MSSPFKIFHKHQKAIMAVTIIFTMLSFVVLAGVSKLLDASRGGGSGEKVAATWKYGEITERQISERMVWRGTLNGFCQALWYEAHRNRGETRIPQRRDQFPTTRGDVITSILLDKRAEELGIRISDNAVFEFIKQQTNDHVKISQIAEIISKLKYYNSPVSQTQIYDAIRRELASREAWTPFVGAEWDVGATPAQRWDYHQRINRHVTAQLVAIDIEDFIDQVDDPTEEQLKDFYEAHQETFTSPRSPEIGFRLPLRAEFEYLKADLAMLIESAKAKVTEEQITAYFEEHKESYRQSEEPAPFSDDFDDFSFDDSVPGTTDPDVAADPDASTEPEPKSGDNDAKKRSEKPNGIKPDSPETVPSEDEATQTPEAPTNEKNDGAIDESATDETTAESYVSLLQDDEPVPSPDGLAPDDEGADDGDEENKGAAKDDVTTDKAAGGEEVGSDADADDDNGNPRPPEPSDDPDESVDLSKLLDPRGRPPEPKLEDDEILAKYRDVIIQQIARRAAIETMDEAIRNAAKEMRTHSAQWKKDGRKAARPELDISTLKTAANGLTYYKTGLISEDDAFLDKEFGRSLVGRRWDAKTETVKAAGQPFFAAAFSKMLVFDARRSASQDGDIRYAFWKTREEKEHLPDFDTIRDQVIRSWKIANTTGTSARTLATKRAEAYAERTNTAQTTLKDQFADDSSLEVIETDTFSWYTYGSVPGNPMRARLVLGRVTDVDMTGEDFMKAVFSLSDREVGTAMNYPQTVVYAVQVFDSDDSDLNRLRSDFKMRPYVQFDRGENFGSSRASKFEQDAIAIAWFKQLREMYELEEVSTESP